MPITAAGSRLSVAIDQMIALTIAAVSSVSRETRSPDEVRRK